MKNKEKEKNNEKDLIVDIGLVKWLIYKSGITAVEISKQTGVGQQTVKGYRTKDTQLMNMSLKTGVALTKYAKTIKEMK